MLDGGPFVYFEMCAVGLLRLNFVVPCEKIYTIINRKSLKRISCIFVSFYFIILIVDAYFIAYDLQLACWFLINTRYLSRGVNTLVLSDH